MKHQVLQIWGDENLSFRKQLKKPKPLFFVTQKARNYTVKPQNLNIIREGAQGSEMYKYGGETVLNLQFVKWIMACKCLESISSSCVWNMMLNAHKQGGAKLYGNTGCYVLPSGVLCVLFYTDVLPFSFAFSLFFSWSAVYSPVWSRELACCITNKMLCGYIVDCLSVIFRMKAQQTASRQTYYETGSLNTAPGRKKSCFIHSQCGVNGFCRNEGMGIVPASAMPDTFFTDKTDMTTLAQVPH